MNLLKRLLLASAIPFLAACSSLGQGTFNTLTVAGNLTLGGYTGIVVGNGPGSPASSKTISQAGGLAISNNLSDVANPATSRSNLGLGSAATQNSSAFDVSGAAATAQANAETYTLNNALFQANNLSDLTNPATARNNIGLGSSTGVNFQSVTTGVNGFVNGGQMQWMTPSPYPTGNTIQIRFDLQGFAQISLTTSSAFFSPSGSSGLKAGAQQLLLLKNVSGVSCSLGWPASWNTMGGIALPASLANGQSMWLWLSCAGSTENSVYAATFDALGAAIAAINAGGNGHFGQMQIDGALIENLVGYPAGNNITVQFALGPLAIIPLITNASFSPSGSGNVRTGTRQSILLYNTTGSNLSLTYNAAWNGASSLPSSIAPGATILLELACNGGSESNVYAASTTVGGGGGGGVTQIIAGSNVSISPIGGTGAVTINAIGGGTGAVPTGGMIYQRLAKNSATNYDSGWYSDTYINAKDYGVTANGSTDDTAALISAWTAAVSAHGTLLLPAGKMVISSDPFAGVAVTGFVGVKGMGRRVSIFQQNGATSGLTFNCSTGTPGNNAVNVSDFSVIGNNSGCTTGVTIDYGSTSLGSADLFSSIEDVDVQEFATEFYFRQCWDLQAVNLYAYGDAGNYTGGSGRGTGACFLVDGCINPNFSGVQHRFSAKGFQFVSSVSGPLSSFQGCQIVNYVGVEVLSFIYMTSNNGSGTLNLTNFTLDDGNLSVSSHEPIHLENCGAFEVSNGQILQNGGNDMVYLKNSARTHFSNVDFTDASLPHCFIFDTGCTDSIVTGCVLGTAVPIQANSGTSGIYASANRYTFGSNSDSGSGNKIQMTNGF